MRFAFLTIGLAACATTSTTSTPPGGPRGLRASEHLDVAAQHDARAAEPASWPQTTMASPGSPEARDQPIPAPWYRSWDTAGEHTRLAAIHRSEASALQAAYDEACRGLSLDAVTVSPLIRFGVGGWPTATGAIVYLSPDAGTPDALLAALRCHRAYMMLAPTRMDDCPLDLPGLELDARGTPDGITVSLSVKDPARIPELKRRAAHDVEAGHRHHAGSAKPH